MPGIELIRSLFQQASVQGSKSTALSPLGWALAILVGGLVGVQHYNVAVSVGIVLTAYIAAYFWFAFKSPEYLRSERYSLSKMAIEKSVKGDDIAGFFSPEVVSEQLPTLPNESTATLPAPTKRKRGQS